MAPRKLHGLQYLRALAALAVVVFHAAGRAGRSFPVGESGVDIFFVLSGFLMVAITDPATRPLPFLADRARRIVPMYWLATTTILLGSLAGLFPGIVLTQGYVAASYLFVPSISPSNLEIWPLLVPGWTLNFEMMFYVAFAAAMAARSQVRQMVALTVGFAGLAAVGLAVEPANTALRFYADPLVLEFAAGGWLGIAWKRSARWERWPGLSATLAGAAGFVAAGLFEPPVERALLYGIPAVALVAGVLGLERRRPIGRWRPALLLGDASYSIYLWHTLAMPVVSRALPDWPAGTAPAWTILLFSLAGVLGGVAGHLLLERPVLRYFRERRYRGAVPIPAGP